jgi:aryl-alcohol dehydrogenase-like predicted oxidoreductase
MEKRQIGSLSVSVVGLGCNNFGRRLDAEGTSKVVNAALDAGINFFDTADVYGAGQSEELLGRELVGRRGEFIIATKFGNKMEGQGSGATAAYIRTALEASLRRLGTDYIDLYQLHLPDNETPIAETLAALDELVKEGKVLEIGSSNFSAEQIREAEAAVKPNAARFVSLQNEYSLLQRDDEAEVLPECERLGIGYLPYFPLASGMLTGKYRQGQALPAGTRITNNPDPSRWLNEKSLEQVEALARFAEATGHSLLELAFSWLLVRPVVASVIAGAMSPDQVQSNVAAVNWKLSPAELAEVDTILSS